MDHAATEQAFALALLDAALPVPAGVTTARGTPDAKRFAVYRNNVAVGLGRALANRFPAVEKLVGADFFAVMARAFIAKSKPSSPILTAYGDAFPDFIAAFEPAACVPYLADVARLEAAWTRAYHAADSGALEISALLTLDAEVIASSQLVPHPAAAIVMSDFPVGSIWQAHQAQDFGSARMTASECVLVVRPGFDVGVHILPACDSVFAEALFDGKAIGEAAERATVALPAFDFGKALIGLTSLGAFSHISNGESSHD
jgi:hypothetical protein